MLHNAILNLTQTNISNYILQCTKSSSIHSALREMSYGFRTRVKTYGIYDVNGYRFRSEKYEKSKLATINTGVCVSALDADEN